MVIFNVKFCNRIQHTLSRILRMLPKLSIYKIAKVKLSPINIFYSEENGGYIADIPDLKYCSAFGETEEEALHCCFGG